MDEEYRTAFMLLESWARKNPLRSFSLSFENGAYAFQAKMASVVVFDATGDELELLDAAATKLFGGDQA